jgi:ABC-2 type transport system permease protein
VVGHLVWLKSRLLWNGLRADRQRRIGFPLAVIVLAAGAMALQRLYEAGLQGLSPAASDQLALWAALGFFAAWVALPVVIFPLDENLDPAQFALAPTPPISLVGGLGAASLVAPSAAALVILLGSNLVLLSGGPGILLGAVASLALLGQLVIAGQLFTTLISAILKSRRGRDLALLIVVGIGLGGFGAQLTATRAISTLGLEGAVLAHPLDVWTWLPPLAAQRSILASAAGDWPVAIAALVVAVAWIPLLGWAWVRMLGWMLTTPQESSGPARRSRRRGLAGGSGWSARRVMARKELRFYLRDPRQRLVWTGAVIFVGLAAASILVGTGGLSLFRDQQWLPLLAPALVLFVGLPIALNQFGWERNAASYLFVLPVRPRQMLLGKNLAVTLAVFIESAAMAVTLATLSGGWAVLPLVPALTFCAVACQLAVGNLTSVITPLRLPREGTDVFAQSTEQGCLAILSQMVSFFVIGLLLVLPASVTVLTVGFGSPIPYWFASSFAAVWGLVFYLLSIAVAGWLLRRRLPEVVQWVQVV